ncbi:hypothetical protein [Taibaiella koreensis]|uniref:hypothetical protein n=1 Tax=Taibaiella koreensis TaxID=1268548 RepID=UPI000E59F94E|nr:hypothetical protein [Taibaiella koreensis]
MKNLLIVLLLLTISSCCLDFARAMKMIVKPYNWEGEIVAIFRDSTDRMMPKVAFKHGDTAVIYAYEMFGMLQLGDSVIKKKGSLKYILKRKGEPAKEFYPKCDGVEIK